MAYDLTLGAIALPTLEVDFSETIGADYTLVGAVPMPGPPRPASLYNMTIPVHGEPEEVDRGAAGIAKRLAVRSLLQNDATRLSGIALTFVYDTDINGYLVIGTADLSYGPGNVTFGDFVLKISGAALIPAAQTLSAHRLLVADRRLPTTPLNTTRSAYRGEQLDAPATARHYLPVGAFDVVGQADPRGMKTHEYKTIFGDGVYVEDRLHGELVRFDQDWDKVHVGNVRVFDTRGNDEPEWSARGDREPDYQDTYAWVPAFSSAFPFTGEWPVLDNGVVRVRKLKNTKFALDTADGDHYKLKTSTFDLGFENVRRVMLTEWSNERAALRAIVEDNGDLADVGVILQRGWRGPRIEMTYHSEKHPKVKATEEFHRDSGKGWETVQLGASADEALMGTVGQAQIIGRF